jgi:hypothetical protein
LTKKTATKKIRVTFLFFNPIEIVDCKMSKLFFTIANPCSTSVLASDIRSLILDWDDQLKKREKGPGVILNSALATTQYLLVLAIILRKAHNPNTESYLSRSDVLRKH